MVIIIGLKYRYILGLNHVCNDIKGRLRMEWGLNFSPVCNNREELKQNEIGYRKTTLIDEIC